MISEKWSRLTLIPNLTNLGPQFPIVVDSPPGQLPVITLTRLPHRGGWLTIPGRRNVNERASIRRESRCNAKSSKNTGKWTANTTGIGGHLCGKALSDDPGKLTCPRGALSALEYKLREGPRLNITWIYLVGLQKAMRFKCQGDITGKLTHFRFPALDKILSSRPEVELRPRTRVPVPDMIGRARIGLRTLALLKLHFHRGAQPRYHLERAKSPGPAVTHGVREYNGQGPLFEIDPAGRGVVEDLETSHNAGVLRQDAVQRNNERREHTIQRVSIFEHFERLTLAADISKLDMAKSKIEEMNRESLVLME
ncbi:hypothetical protein C8F04DRAFT_1186569 [Mycena alexandri]|uniref:Uncharacterized protein n=1 Tax=Mycena alexandri TaxID=1745969 RepID=A0AAD6SNH7_9AGAR|nr:hypothetical protein C8F04DRAFT_1186569 [Mycena alexandri]